MDIKHNAVEYNHDYSNNPQDDYNDEDDVEYKPPGKQGAGRKRGKYNKMKKIFAELSEVEAKEDPRIIYKDIPEHIPKKKEVVTERLVCDFCNEAEEFTSVWVLSQHVWKNHEEKVEEFDLKYRIFKCHISENDEDCKHAYYTKKGLFKHLLRAHNLSRKSLKSVSQVCNECDISFPTNTEYKKHLRQHHADSLEAKPFQCDQCEKRYAFRCLLKEHIAKAHTDFFQRCLHCGIPFDDKNEYRMHMKKKHIAKAPTDFSQLCPHCGIPFDDQKEYRMHMRKKHKKSKPKPEQCSECSEVLANHNRWKYHMFKCHNVGGVHCDICFGRHFNQKLLDQHRTVHLEKSVPCDQCDRMFKNDFSLRRHKDNIHKSSQDKQYKCNQCGKGFSQKVVYEGHMNMHLGLKPYKCEFCGAAYQNQSNLLAHKRKSCKSLSN